MVARHHGRYTEGSGLRGPGAPQLRNDRGSRAGAIGAFFKARRIRMRKLITPQALLTFNRGLPRIAHTGTGGSPPAAKNPPTVREDRIGGGQAGADQVPSEKNLSD